jgi:hypothetical protein
LAGEKVQHQFSQCVQRMHLSLASALSFFVFTFQGIMESALSAFDCKQVDSLWLLRSNPKINCSFDSGEYFGMVITAIIGLLLYCVVIPLIAVITLRSRWCQEVYNLERMTYTKIFGFLTSMYSKRCVLWELVACLRKVAFVAFPVFISKDVFVQSVSMFSSLLVYTFLTLKIQPMASTVLNRIEMLSCISLTLGTFSAVFFVIEYDGSLVLSGASRDLFGAMLVIMCGVCVFLSLALLWTECSSRPVISYINLASIFFLFLIFQLLNLCRTYADVQQSVHFKVGCWNHDSTRTYLQGRICLVRSLIVLQRCFDCCYFGGQAEIAA